MGHVAEFEKMIVKRAGAKYGSWHLVDLHNHSPQSDEYKYNGPDIIEKLATRIIAADLSVVMFTDHNKLPDLGLVRNLAEKTGKLILRGVEMNVFVDAYGKPEDKVAKNMFYHLLIGFEPDGKQSPDYWLSHIFRKCEKETRISGGNSLEGIKASIRELHKILEDANAIIIPAHLHSTPDAFKSRSIDNIISDAEFLNDAREYFTALEVISTKTAAFFDGEHTETNRLYKSCIQSSDSHEPESLGWRATYVQMERPSFAELKAALELPFRVSLTKPEKPNAHVIGMHIRGEFFSDSWLSFSPYCNVLIGVKGSGKTSVLEGLRFALGTDVPKPRKEEVKSHLNAILGPSGKVTILLKRADGAKLCVERSVTENSFNVTFEDDRQERFDSTEGLLFPNYILGWHEIEQVATDQNIRRIYMDNIAGKSQINEIEEKMQLIGKKIRKKHDAAAKLYSEYRDLHKQVSRMEELRKGLQELKDADLIALKDKYQAATDHREALKQLLEQFKHLKEESRSQIIDLASSFDKKKLEGASPLEEGLRDACKVMDELAEVMEHTGRSLEEKLVDLTTQFEKQINMANAVYESFVQAYTAKISTLTPEQKHLLETHREVLELTKGLSSLESERARAKENVERLLRELQDLCENLANALDERTRIRSERIEEFNRNLERFGVRLQLVPQQNAVEFQELSSRYAQGAKVLGELRTKIPERLAHLCLKKAYGDFLSGFATEYGSMLFDYSDFTYFLSVFENDDLRIELKVGKAGEEFSPIDQLSAGQRCTAIFPILLLLSEGPLVIDQPEDNLDNRHIAGIISPILLKAKIRRQMIFTSHNANLVVLSDSESICAFDSDGAHGKLEAQGFLATKDSPIAKHVLDTLDGGQRALELRILKYGIQKN